MTQGGKWNINYQQSNYLKAVMWNFALALLTFGFFMVKEQGLFSLSADFDLQIVSFTKLVLDTVQKRTGIWNWNIDLGTNIVNTMSYYRLGSPFFWLFSLCGSNNVLYFIGWEYIVKYTFAGLASYCYLRKYVKNHTMALAGSVMYAFSGFQAMNLMYSIFHDAAALFPFMLLVFEELVENDKKRWFALTVAINALVNYYCFVGEVIFLILYYIIRYLVSNWKKNIKKAGVCIWEGCLGIGMAFVLFFPSLISVLHNSRVSSGIEWARFARLSRRELLQIVASFLLPGEMSMERSCIYSEDWSSRSAYLPMVGIALVLAYLMKRNKKDWLKRVVVGMAILMVLPLGNGVFSLFTTAYCRWFYMPILFLVLASIKAAEDWDAYPIKYAVIGMLVFIVGQYIGFHWWDRNKFRLILNEERFTFLSFMALAGICMLGICCFLKNIEHIRTNIFLGFVSLFAVLTTGYTCRLYQDYDKKDSFVLQREMELLQEVKAYTTDGIRILSEEDNINMLGEYKGINSFISTISGSIPKFWARMGEEKVIFSPTGPVGTNELLSVKYFLTKESDKDRHLIKSFGEGSECYFLYQMEDWLDIGFTYDSYLTAVEFEQIPLEKRALTMLDALVIDDAQEETVNKVLQKKDIASCKQLTENDLSQLVQSHQLENAADFVIGRDEFHCIIETDRSKYAFFSVPFDKGWRAFVNGSEVSVVDSNGFMAIPIEAGRNMIEFRFFDKTLLSAGIVSISFVCLWIVYSIKVKKRKNKK